MTAIAAVVGYLLGSVPTAEFLGRLRGIDLRQEGSGNPGAANALRTPGPRTRLMVLSVGIGLLISWKHWRAAQVNSPAPH